MGHSIQAIGNYCVHSLLSCPVSLQGSFNKKQIDLRPRREVTSGDIFRHAAVKFRRNFWLHTSSSVNAIDITVSADPHRAIRAIGGVRPQSHLERRLIASDKVAKMRNAGLEKS